MDDSWKKHYWKSYLSDKHMTAGQIRYETCTIRQFEDLIKLVDSYQNFVFAADTAGNVKVFLIDERDLENENEEMKIEALAFPEGVEYLKFDNNQLVIVTSIGMVYTFQIEQTARVNFTINLLSNI